MPNLCVGEVNIPVAEFNASDAGLARLERSPDLLEALARFSLCTDGEDPKTAFNPGPDTIWERTYTGSLTETNAFGYTAIEASTFTTGRDRWKQGFPTTDRSRSPNWNQAGTSAFRASGAQSFMRSLPSMRQRRSPRVDLVQQSMYLDALGGLIGADSEEELFVPDQWFALRTLSGDTLAASRLVPGWTTLNNWLRDHGDAEHNALGIDFDADRTIEQVAGRVRAAVGNSALQHGLDELLLGGEGRYFGDTMIVPKNITSPRDSRVGVVRLSPVRQSRTYRRAMGAAAELLADRAASEDATRELESAQQVS